MMLFYYKKKMHDSTGNALSGKELKEYLKATCIFVFCFIYEIIFWICPHKCYSYDLYGDVNF